MNAPADSVWRLGDPLKQGFNVGAALKSDKGLFKRRLIINPFMSFGAF
jgi:hypothetical protein